MIVVVGLSHRTAPIAVRERLAVRKETVPDLLRAVVARPGLAEAMLVTTCNRVELVVAPRRSETVQDPRIVEQAVEVLTEQAREVRPHLYSHAGLDGVRHLFRVAASLDSLVLGEPQILGQVKEGYELARAVGAVGPVLHRVVARAVRTAKRVRTQTSIGTGLVSVPSVAVDLAGQIFGNLARKTALLVGSGEMAESVARLLRNAGAKIIVVGRTLSRVDELARAFDAEARPWSALGATLPEADVVITSTSAPGYVIDHAMVASSRRSRRGKSAFFIDLAVPRDVDPSVEGIDGVFLYNVDDFSKVVAESRESRQREAERAEHIVARETADYERWTEVAQVTPTIVALRDKTRQVLQAELERTLRTRLKHLSAEDRSSLERMLDAATNKLLHAPTSRLREAAADGLKLEQMVALTDELFELSAEPAPSRPPDSELPSSPEQVPATHPESAAIPR